MQDVLNEVMPASSKKEKTPIAGDRHTGVCSLQESGWNIWLKKLGMDHPAHTLLSQVCAGCYI